MRWLAASFAAALAAAENPDLTNKERYALVHAAGQQADLVSWRLEGLRDAPAAD